MERPKIANEDSFSDLAVPQNPSRSHEVQWCSYFGLAMTGLAVILYLA